MMFRDQTAHRRKHLRMGLSALCVVSISLFYGCSASTKEIRPEADAQLLPVEDEVKFGYYVDAVVCSEFPVLKDERLTAQVSAIGNSLVDKSLRPDLDFNFRILNTETVNAFAAPGGFVYITIGLLDKLESKDELAAILGHEIGHVCARHSIKAWYTAQKISKPLTVIDIAAIIAGLPPIASAGGDIIADVGQTVAQLASVIVYQGYSRTYEYQADELGLQEMYHAGYDPEATISVFEKLIRLREEEGNGEGIVLLSSHPPMEDRIEHTRSFLAGLQDPHSGSTDD
ncbi:MAG: M48 family metalloprotease [Deltaproteobacteria bacterium]|nr:M48 family metalloprotease [Deltaproteobacteria bacterium]